jgi:PRTRC genetic system protein B
MNARTDLLMSEFKPSLAIMIYNNSNEYYLESHDINERGQVMAGKPLLQETIQGMIDVFFDERQNVVNITGMLPENMLYFQAMPGGNYKMIWYRMAEIRVLHTAPQLKLPVDKTWVPPLIYVASSKQMEVYALKSNSRPKEKTKLYLAPFFNVNDDGDVCLGNARVQKPKVKTYSSLMQYWEDLFWLSEFTHINGGEKTRSGLKAVWLKLLKSKTTLKWSDMNDEMIAYKNKTLKNLF